LQVRSSLTDSVRADSVLDIDKTGVILVNDILEVRANLTRQLRNIIVP
jgi:hypothetical protein